MARSSGETNSYKILIDKTTTSNKTYIGKANKGSLESLPLWQIFIIDKTTDITKILFADGDSEFDNIWDNRISLNYI